MRQPNVGDRLSCSVWTNGSTGWGLKVLGGPEVRREYFRREVSPVLVEVDGTEHPFNVDKGSFWTESCGELIGKPLREWKDRHQLRSKERALLIVVEPFRRFKLQP